jgi:hypothetical protein
MDAPIATNGDFSAVLSDAQGALDGIEATLPADPGERTPGQTLQSIMLTLIRIQLDAATALRRTSEAVVDLVESTLELEGLEPVAIEGPGRLPGSPRAEITAKILHGIEPALGIRRGRGPVDWARELAPLGGPRWRRRRRRATVAGILGPGSS